MIKNKTYIEDEEKYDYKITIIIPAYNVEDYLKYGIESCLRQTYTNIEVIIVDDGSSDKTWLVIEDYLNKDERVIAYKKNNGGVSSARNVALSFATGDYVLFLDSDDWLEENAVATLVDAIPKDEDLFLISADAYYAYANNNKRWKKSVIGNLKNIHMKSQEIIMYIGKNEYKLRSACYKLFSLKIIKKHNLKFSESIQHGEDGLFVFEYLKYVNDFYYIAKPLWNILERPGSATTSGYNKSKLTMIDAIEKMMSYDNDISLQIVLEKYLVMRMNSLICDILISEDSPLEDFYYVRKRLRNFFIIYLWKEKSLKNRLFYLFVTLAPRKLITMYLKRKL